MVSERWIEHALYRLVVTAWGPRRTVPTERFVLSPDSLQAVLTNGNLAAAVQHCYDHARDWAPGFEVPFSIPRVRFGALWNGAGGYDVDSEGLPHIQIHGDFRNRPAATLAVLAHQACHHIIDLSGFWTPTRREREHLVALAAFVCGFGEVVLKGYPETDGSGSGRASMTLGHLTHEQCRFANDWVLWAQSISISDRTSSSDSPQAAPQKRSAVMAGLRGWFKRPDIEGPQAESAPAEPARSAGRFRYPRFDPHDVTREIARVCLGGCEARLSRLLSYERMRQPHADHLSLLDAVLERLERDRR